MLDDLDRLRNNPHLLRLLSHYGELGQPNREAWQNRLMALEGVEAPELVKLHGELIAFGWIEQNTGHTPFLQAGLVPACYRVTSLGLRAIQQVTSGENRDEETVVAAVETAQRFPRKRQRRGETSEAGVIVSAGIATD